MSCESNPAISIRGVSKTYRVYGRPYQRVLQGISRRLGRSKEYGFEVKAVQDVSFDIEVGSTVAIIGRNGSGKSTLLEMITGTLTPTAGSIDVRGRISALLELGAGFNNDFTGRENYRLNASILGLSDAQIREREPVVEAFAELGDFMDEPVRTYSSGMYVRLAFATAVHVSPEILIVDEALAVGDVFFQQKCYAFIENELADVTKIIVTHDLATAAKLADRCILLDKGELVFEGAPLEAVQRYTAIHLAERSGIAGASGGASAGGEGEPGQQSSLATDATAREVDPNSSSNPDAFSISHVVAEARSADNPIPVPLSGELWPCVPGQVITLRFLCEVGIAVEAPVLGYLMRDRVGNPVFGQNSLGSNFVVDRLTPGSYEVSMSIEWPEVEPGDYVLTIGLGDGRHEHHHHIVSWVQGVAGFTSVPERPVHGMWNNDLLTLSMDPVSR